MFLSIADIFNLCCETHHSLLIIHWKNVQYYFSLLALYFTRFISQLSEYTARPSVTIFVFLWISFYRIFNAYEEYDFARTGSTATEKVCLIRHFFFATSIHTIKWLTMEERLEDLKCAYQHVIFGFSCFWQVKCCNFMFGCYTFEVKLNPKR